MLKDETIDEMSRLLWLALPDILISRRYEYIAMDSGRMELRPIGSIHGAFVFDVSWVSGPGGGTVATLVALLTRLKDKWVQMHPSPDNRSLAFTAPNDRVEAVLDTGYDHETGECLLFVAPDIDDNPDECYELRLVLPQ